MMILMIDNYDSFTYMIVQYLKELGGEVCVKRNDELTMADIARLDPTHIVISPGPCTPNEAGISMQVVQHFMDKKPILGVCLGHQCIAQILGGHVQRAKEVMHGKTSVIYHNNTGIFHHVINQFRATRYHSLVVNAKTLPSELEINAWTQTQTGDFDEIMGFRHKHFALHGVQFHPESIMTEHGHLLFQNFLRA